MPLLQRGRHDGYEARPPRHGGRPPEECWCWCWCFGVLVFWCFGVCVFWCFGVGGVGGVGVGAMEMHSQKCLVHNWKSPEVGARVGVGVVGFGVVGLAGVVGVNGRCVCVWLWQW